MAILKKMISETTRMGKGMCARRFNLNYTYHHTNGAERHTYPGTFTFMEALRKRTIMKKATFTFTNITITPVKEI